MDTFEKCWFFQCLNPECGCVALANDIVLKKRYDEGIVPCPKCGQSLQIVREAEPGEYDDKRQQALAEWASIEVSYWLATPFETYQCTRQCPCRPNSFTDMDYSGNPRGRLNVNGAGPEKTSNVDTKRVDFFTEADLAQHFGVSVRVVKGWVSQKKLGALQLTKKKRVFSQAHIDEFIQRGI